MTSKTHRFGLVGKDISYSFSRGYFKEKFKSLGLTDHSYENFDLQTITQFESVVKDTPHLKGLNVTIPYKEAVIPYLNELDDEARQIGAVNTIQFTKSGLKGFNTDAYGFKNALAPHLRPHHKKALILGTGGASKAVAHVLKNLDMDVNFVSRNPSPGQLGYSDLDERILDEFTVLVNCTPLGTHPNVEQRPDLPYGALSKKHLLFDLIYNPDKTAFLKEGEIRGARICNGRRMLELQADRAWEIWQE
ncbi:shikimate dehydrogenase family protein [Pseudozobellia thermophila]|uniref:Shikimate dehydrogenase n=1 Tax=Pseudozobellia thermophila TaxID=192903 RepID=A0A1M6J407_9FLAO|nr:shikimate dehydrogenase [Pseudozobellia thermophila]SHJ41433.1 shikimate dehydrogenase [Pseudozobellia thermophila]